jgi:hypothetical protein
VKKSNGVRETGTRIEMPDGRWWAIDPWSMGCPPQRYAELFNCQVATGCAHTYCDQFVDPPNTPNVIFYGETP